MASRARRPLNSLRPDERAALLPLLRAMNPSHPAWKTRPLPLDIARATLASIERKDLAGFAALDEALVSLGVDLSEENLDFGSISHLCGNCALHLAIASGADAIAGRILERGGDANHGAGGSDGLRPLHVAVLADNPAMIHALLRHGADPDAPDARGRSSRALAETVAWKRGLRSGHAILNGKAAGD